MPGWGGGILKLRFDRYITFKMLSWLCYISLVVNVCYCFIFYLVATRVLEHPHELHGSKLTICRFIPTVARQVKCSRRSDSLESLLSFAHHSQHLISWNRLFNNVIFPRSRMGSESIAHEAEGRLLTQSPFGLEE